MATLKYSRQRESIKEFLTGRTDHPTADFVYENMKQIYPNISLIDKSLENIAADFKDGQISDYKARFFGICNECLKEESH